MKRFRFTDQQIAFALQQAEQGKAVGEVIRKMRISEQTFPGPAFFSQSEDALSLAKRTTYRWGGRNIRYDLDM